MKYSLKLKEIGKNAKYFNPNEKSVIKLEKNAPLEVMRGYKTSVSINDHKMQLLIDFASRVMR